MYMRSAVIFQDNLREDLDSKSLDIDIDKLSISDKSESTETDNLSQVSIAERSLSVIPGTMSTCIHTMIGRCLPFIHVRESTCTLWNMYSNVI